MHPELVAALGKARGTAASREVIDLNTAEFLNVTAMAKPDLVVVASDLPATVHAVRDLLATSDSLFDRGGLVQVIRHADGSMPVAVPLTRHNVVMEIHKLCQPVKIDADGKRKPVTLPDRVAQM